MQPIAEKQLSKVMEIAIESWLSNSGKLESLFLLNIIIIYRHLALLFFHSSTREPLHQPSVMTFHFLQV